MIERYQNSRVMAQAAAERIVSLAQAAVADHGRFTIALSGGTTPESTYRLLASEAYASRIDWSKFYAFWGDERCVPPDDQQSNFRMAWEVLLKRVPIPQENVFRIFGEMQPDLGADDYQRRVTAFFALKARECPRFDLVLLGMGDDGHTASLFPDSPALRETARLVVAQFVEQLDAWRITFTLPMINAAANIAFLVSSGKKANKVRQVLAGPSQSYLLPAQMVQPRNGELIWMLDTDASALLPQR
ncbi:MAG TPA: 6-phosphogluconolactonase [Armatimonadota bacterium]